MDELNTMWNSKDPATLFEFYNHFDNNMKLIKWMKRRPRAPIKIYESEGAEDLCVVIPTPNHKNAYSKSAKKIYKGLKIIFVESSGPYFNFARSVNHGLAYILKKYKPDWIILSNDDIYGIDKIEVLRKELAALDKDKIDVVFRTIGKEHDALYGYDLYGYFVKPDPLLFKIYARIQPESVKKHYLSLFEKFKINYLVSTRLSRYGFLSNIVFRDKVRFYGNIMCMVFSRKFVEGIRGKILDETYINGFDDCDLFLKITQKYNYRFINFRLGCHTGKSLGAGDARRLRDIANLAYFNHKLFTNRSISRR